ncbi:MAG: XdhC family protein [Pigmentiphaga sp.]|nr:XdhC family protein [Pigmentiphaga sp.]
MSPLDLEVLQSARDWLRAGHPVHLVSVVQTWGSAPRQAGAMLAVRGDGRVMGSVSGGCVEDDLVRRAREDQLGTAPRRLNYGVTRESAAQFGLPCGGTLELVCEPLRDPAWLDEVLDAIRQHRLIRRELDLETGTARLLPATPADGPCLNGGVFRNVYGPRWRLLIIGANQTARVLCAIAGTLDFHVIVCDPREEFFADWNEPQATLLTTMPDDTVLEIGTNERTAIVAVTHDPKLDDMALLEALKSPAFYVGALGSRANQAKRRERLRLFDLSEKEIERLHGPVGLRLGSRTPAEIAVAIAAELVLVRNALGGAEMGAIPESVMADGT